MKSLKVLLIIATVTGISYKEKLSIRLVPKSENSLNDFNSLQKKMRVLKRRLREPYVMHQSESLKERCPVGRAGNIRISSLFPPSDTSNSTSRISIFRAMDVGPLCFFLSAGYSSIVPATQTDCQDDRWRVRPSQKRKHLTSLLQ